MTRFDAPFTVVGPQPLVATARDLADRVRASAGDLPTDTTGQAEEEART